HVLEAISCFLAAIALGVPMQSYSNIPIHGLGARAKAVSDMLAGNAFVRIIGALIDSPGDFRRRYLGACRAKSYESEGYGQEHPGFHRVSGSGSLARYV